MTEYLYLNPVTTRWMRSDPPAMSREAAARTFNTHHPRYTACYVTAVLAERNGVVIPCPNSVTRVVFNDRVEIHDLAQARIK